MRAKSLRRVFGLKQVFTALVLVLPFLAVAQPTVISHTESAIGGTDIHIRAVLSSPTTVYLRYRTSTFSDCTTGSLSKTPTDPYPGVGSPTSNPEFLLYGLTKGTQYYYAVCQASDDSMLAGGSPPYTFTTTNSAAIHPAPPTPPTTTGITGITPTTFATSNTVNSTCTNLQGFINTAAADTDADNHEIVVPTTTTSCGSITLKPHSGSGKIVIRSGGLANLPPDNTRVDPTAHAQHMFDLRPAIGTTAISCEAGARNYIIIGADAEAPGGVQTAPQIEFSSCSDTYVDRSYLHARYMPDSSASIVRLNGTRNGLLNSWVVSAGGRTDVHGEASAIVGDDANKVLLRNNYLTGTGAGIVFFTANALPAVNQDADVVYNTIVADEKQRKGSAVNTPPGQYYTFRQLVEVKTCVRCRFYGNRLDNGWLDQVISTGAFLISPRMTADGSSCVSPRVRVVSDVDIGYNFLGKVHGLVYTGGWDDLSGCEPYPVQRIRVHNNVVSNIDTVFTPSNCWPGTGTCDESRGHLLGVAGATDLIFENNTWFELSLGMYGGRLVTMNDGLCGDCRFDNNIAIFRDNGGTGGVRWVGSQWVDGTVPSDPKDKLAEMWPRFSFKNNVLRVKSPSTTADIQDKFPTGNFWPGDDVTGLSKVGFEGKEKTSNRLQDFCLALGSTYNFKSKEGRQVGANCVKVLEQVGGVYNVSVQSTTATTATVGFMAPAGLTRPGTACAADVNTDSSFPAAGNTRFTATIKPAIPWAQTFQFTGLTSDTQYYYRIYCAGAPFSGSFRAR